MSHELNLEELAAYLGCDPENIFRLALCRRPDATALAFNTDVEHLARRFGIQSDRLFAIIREVDSLQSLRDHLAFKPQSDRMLLAARDREDDESDPDAQESGDD